MVAELYPSKIKNSTLLFPSCRANQPGTLALAPTFRRFQGSPAIIGRLVDVDTGGSQQQLHARAVAVPGRPVEGSPAILIRLVDIDAGSSQQQTNALAVAIPGRT